MTDEPGTTEDCSVEDDAALPQRTWPRRILRGALIVIYSIVFTIIFATTILIALEYSGFRPEVHRHDVLLILIPVVFFGAMAFCGYLASAYMVRRRPRLTKWVSVLGIAVPLIAWAGWVGYGKFRLVRAVAAWEEIGGWVGESPTDRDLVPEEQNAAAIYRTLPTNVRVDVSAHYERESNSFVIYTAAPDGSDQWQVVPIDQIRATIARHESWLQTAARASRLPYCQWERPVYTDPGIVAVFRLSQLLKLAAEERIQAGAYHEAAEYLLTLLRLSRQVADDSMSLESSWNSLSNATLLLHYIPIDADFPWEAFEREFALWDGPQMAAKSIVNVGSALAGIYTQTDMNGLSGEVSFAYSAGLLNLDFAMYLEYARESYDAALRNTADGGSLPAPPEKVWYRPLCSDWRIVDRRRFEDRDWIDAERDVATVALRLIRHRREHGDFPESIESFIGQRRFPVNGKPYGYSHWSTGFKIIVPRDHYGPYADVWGSRDPNEPEPPNSDGELE